MPPLYVRVCEFCVELIEKSPNAQRTGLWLAHSWRQICTNEHEIWQVTANKGNDVCVLKTLGNFFQKRTIRFCFFLSLGQVHSINNVQTLCTTHPVLQLRQMYCHQQLIATAVCFSSQTTYYYYLRRSRKTPSTAFVRTHSPVTTQRRQQRHFDQLTTRLLAHSSLVVHRTRRRRRRCRGLELSCVRCCELRRETRRVVVIAAPFIVVKVNRLLVGFFKVVVWFNFFEKQKPKQNKKKNDALFNFAFCSKHCKLTAVSA